VQSNPSPSVRKRLTISRTPLLRFIERSPSPSKRRASTPRVRKLSRPEGANLQACSVRAVSHDFDGLLRTTPRKSVAPCNRPWGSPGFTPVNRSSLELPQSVVTLRSVSLSGSSARSPFPKECSPEPDPLSPLLLLCSCVLPHRRSALARPQGVDPPESPLRNRKRCRLRSARCSPGLMARYGVANACSMCRFLAQKSYDSRVIDGPESVRSTPKCPRLRLTRCSLTRVPSPKPTLYRSKAQARVVFEPEGSPSSRFTSLEPKPRSRVRKTAAPKDRRFTSHAPEDV
jgi:hypothetical protein